MQNDLNVVAIEGILIADAVLIQNHGNCCTKLCLRCIRIFEKNGRKMQDNFLIRAKVWGFDCTKFMQYLKKGCRIKLTGRLAGDQCHAKSTSKERLVIVVDRLQYTTAIGRAETLKYDTGTHSWKPID